MRNDVRGVAWVDGCVLASRAGGKESEDDAGAGELHGAGIALDSRSQRSVLGLPGGGYDNRTLKSRRAKILTRQPIKMQRAPLTPARGSPCPR